MSVKDKWKTFGKSMGKAFANFGKAMATTAKVVLGKEDRIDEEGNSNLRKSWSAAGKGFGKAGTALGKAASATAKKAVGQSPSEPDVIDAEIVSETQDEKESPGELTSESQERS